MITQLPQSEDESLKYAVLVDRRPSLTRDLPYGPADLQWVTNTSTLLYGSRDAILIDTFTTAAQNERLVEWVASFDRNLVRIYSTHGHGDHFFGIGQLLRRYREATAVATSGTVREARKHASPAMLTEFWGMLFPGEIPSPLQLPTVIDSPVLELHGHELQIIPTGFTDTEDTTAVWVPSLGLLVAVTLFITTRTRTSRRLLPYRGTIGDLHLSNCPDSAPGLWWQGINTATTRMTRTISQKRCPTLKILTCCAKPPQPPPSYMPPSSKSIQTALILAPRGRQQRRLTPPSALSTPAHERRTFVHN